MSEEGHEEETSQSVHRVLALYFQGQKFGFAFFNEMTSIIQVGGIAEASQSNIVGILSNLKECCKPTLILVQSKTVTNKPLLDVICCDESTSCGGQYDFRVISNYYWFRNYDNAVHDMLRRFDVRSYRPSFKVCIKELTHQENMLRISSCIDLKNHQIVSATGALISFVRSEVFTLDGGLVQVADVQNLIVEDYLRIDRADFEALQIFSEDQHPLLFKEKGRSKEGFSLFSLLDRTVSLPGRDRLRAWLATPFSNLDKIMERQDGIELATRRSNSEFVKDVTKLLRHTHALPSVLLRVKRANSNHNDWIKLCKTLGSSVAIVDRIVSFQEELIAPSDIAFMEAQLQNLNIQVIKNLFGSLNAAIDIVETSERKQVTLLSGFDQELDGLRKTYEHLDDTLAEIAKDILQATPLLNHVSVEYQPQIGYLVAIQERDYDFLFSHDFPSDAMQVNAPKVSNHGYQHIYSSDDMMYFKHPVVNKLDESIGDIHSRLLDYQKTLLLEIESEVLECEYHLMQLGSLLETLDATFSLATIAKERNYVRPEIVEDSVVIIKGGRHPLQELTVDDFIPNDTFMSSEKHIGIVTGPNGSGKSIYLKQVGLLVYLAHVGSFLPCERSVIGLCDRILTRLSNVESASSLLSAFAIDLSQMKHMVGVFTGRSLCLVDEFGKGTAPVDGMALLACAVMKFCRSPPCRALFTTHFLEIFDPKIIDPHQLVSLTTFKMQMYKKNASSHSSDVESSSRSEDAMFGENSPEEVPLFKLKIGIAESSGGISCARRAGVKNDILCRAEKFWNRFKDNTPVDFVDKARGDVNFDLSGEFTIEEKNLLSHFLAVEDWSCAETKDIDNILDDIRRIP